MKSVRDKMRVSLAPFYTPLHDILVLPAAGRVGQWAAVAVGWAPDPPAGSPCLCIQPYIGFNLLKVIRKFFLNHNKSFRWHLGYYGKI